MIETIKATFTQKLDEMGIEVEDVKTKRIFKSLISSHCHPIKSNRETSRPANKNTR